MNDDNGGGRRRADHTQMKWVIVAGLIALALILGTIQEMVK